MDFPEYLHTREEITKEIHSLYLKGMSIEHIMCNINIKFKTNLNFEDINDIIDYNLEIELYG